MPMVLSDAGTRALPIELPREALEQYCQERHIRKLALFGSVLRDEFGPESDIDVLVEFDPEHIPGLAFFTMDADLAHILGRKVDLNTPGCFRPRLREKIENEALVVYQLSPTGGDH